MKYIKTFEEINQRWNRNIDLKYVNEHPDDKSEEADWIRILNSKLEEVIENLMDSGVRDPETFTIVNIEGQTFFNEGPIATVRIFGKEYEVIEVDYPNEPGLKIEEFPVDNTSDEGYSEGFTGTEEEVAEMLKGVADAGGNFQAYEDSKKFNI